MSYRIEVGPEARMEIRALPGYVRILGRVLVRELGQDPRPARSRQLLDEPSIRRIWLGARWRLIYQVEEEPRRIRVLRLRRREDVAYERLDPEVFEVHEPAPQAIATPS